MVRPPCAGSPGTKRGLASIMKNMMEVIASDATLQRADRMSVPMDSSDNLAQHISWTHGGIGRDDLALVAGLTIGRE